MLRSSQVDVVTPRRQSSPDFACCVWFASRGIREADSQRQQPVAAPPVRLLQRLLPPTLVDAAHRSHLASERASGWAGGRDPRGSSSRCLDRSWRIPCSSLRGRHQLLGQTLTFSRTDRSTPRTKIDSDRTGQRRLNTRGIFGRCTLKRNCALDKRGGNVLHGAAGTMQTANRLRRNMHNADIRLASSE